MIRAALPKDQQIWDSLVNHPLQSWAWGEFRTSMGIDVVRLITETHNKPTAAWQLTFHKIPFTSWRIGYFPKGPKPTLEMIDKLTQIGREKHAVFIQLEPNILPSSHHEFVEGTLAHTGWLLPSHHPLFTKYTFVLDLTQSEEELLKQMHPKTRYNLKLAQKHGVKISQDDSPKKFDQYIKLVQETTNRQRFYAHSPEYHRKMWEIMHRSGIGKLFTAEYQGETLAAWILFAWDKILYYPYGASSRLHREVMAPTLLLWEITKWAKSQGYQKFDLWGALGPSSTGGPDKNDPWYGFHRFKVGFNPALVEFAGSFDLVINPTLYQLYKIVDTIRWKILRKKA